LMPSRAARGGGESQRLLLDPAFLALEFDPRLTLGRLHPVGRAAFPADRFDARIALRDGERLFLHGFLDEALGFGAHLLFGYGRRLVHGRLVAQCREEEMTSFAVSTAASLAARTGCNMIARDCRS